MKNKKGQIMIFVILGLIILVSVGMFLYFKTVIQPKPEIIVPEALPVKNYIENCIKFIAEDALATIGANGGYITFPEQIDANPLLYLSVGPVRAYKNPYWDLAGMPTEDYMEKQISSYVTNNIKECLNNFEEFKEEYTIEETGNVVTKTILGDEDITVELGYPITLITRSGESITKLSRFNARIPVRLKKVYELAKKIMERENEEGFIERRVIDLYAMDTSIPTTDVEASCSERRWLLSEIQFQLKKLVAFNLPYIKVARTSYNTDMYVPNPFSSEQTFDESYYNYHYIWDIGEDSYDGMHVGFTYDVGWPLSVYARPSRDGVLKSNVQKGFDVLSLFCLQIWHFTYDINFPVKITIFDEAKDSHDSYTFSFAFKANIDHNEPKRVSSGKTTTTIREVIGSEEFCNDVRYQTTIYTQDTVTADPVIGAELIFNCGVFSCSLGESGFLSSGGDVAGLDQMMPYCVNGILRGTAENYEPADMFIQTDRRNLAYTLHLMPIKEIKNYTVVKHLSSNPSAEKELSSDEKATIIVKNDEHEFESFGIYPLEEDFKLKLLSKDAFTYDITIYLVTNETMKGGYHANWTVSWEQLKYSDSIKFHVIEQDPLPKEDAERYLFIAELGKYNDVIPLPEVK